MDAGFAMAGAGGSPTPCGVIITCNLRIARAERRRTVEPPAFNFNYKPDVHFFLYSSFRCTPPVFITSLHHYIVKKIVAIALKLARINSAMSVKQNDTKKDASSFAPGS